MTEFSATNIIWLYFKRRSHETQVDITSFWLLWQLSVAMCTWNMSRIMCMLLMGLDQRNVSLFSISHSFPFTVWISDVANSLNF